MEEEILENQQIIIVDIEITEGEPSTTISEEVETITVEAPQEVGVEVGEGFGTITSGNGENSHPLLYGRDLKDQHPISAITGLKEKLDSIESLKTLYSDKIGFANYYKWSDGAHDEAGYFVSIVPDSSMIKICEGADIFGVTVDSAAVVGGQDETIPRDNTYALVVTTGLVNVRCKLDVEIDSYVVPNSHGIAERTDSECGYKVVATPKINGTTYATISLGVQACTTDLMAQKIQRLDDRLYEDEKYIGAAMQVANEAFQKAGESANISNEALKDALEALGKTEEMGGVIDDFYENLVSTNQIAVLAKTIADGAVTEAGRIQGEAYGVANDALTRVNDLVAQMAPITSWTYTDPETNEELVGAEYFTTYIKDGVATKAAIEAVETSTTEHKSMIEKSAEEFSSLISSVDKYSVGEYSQAYGLTLAQAQSILKPGMIYIPTKTQDGWNTHKENYEGSPTRYFTMGYFYEWRDIGDGTVTWSESLGEVWFDTEEPPGAGYTYWYNNSSLHILKDGEWVEVATLAGNVNNRITSMIRQDVDQISAEVVNARGGAASLTARIDENEALVQTNAIWMKGETQKGEKLYNLATIQQEAVDESSTLALVVADTEGNKVLGGANIVLSQNGGGSFISLDADHIDFKGGEIKFKASDVDFDVDNYSIDASKISIDGETSFTTDENGETKIDGANISTGSIGAEHIKADAINASHIRAGIIEANHIKMGAIEGDKIQANSINSTHIQTDAIKAEHIQVEDLNALEATIGGWKLDSNSLYSGSSFGSGSFLCTGSTGNSGEFNIGGSGDINGWVFKAGDNFGVTTSGATYCGDIHISGGTFGRGAEFNDGGACFHLFDDDGAAAYCGIMMETRDEGSAYNGNKNYNPTSQILIEPESIRLFVGRISIKEDEKEGEPAGYFKGVGGITIDTNSSTVRGTSYISSPSVITSDQKLKHSIEPLGEKYNTLFDNLKPVRFKYNGGTSDRYHTGLIAQDVAVAIDKAELSTQEVAAYVVRHPGEEDEYSGIRYEEFIALLIQQVQDLKGRVSELEQRLKGENI